MHADRGSNAYPGVVPGTGSEQPAQTANSLPRGFEHGMPAYARPLPVRSAVVENSIYLPRS